MGNTTCNYTKGGWRKQGNKVISETGRGTIAICPPPNTEGTFEFQANAQLVAATPEMYEALRRFVEEYKNMFEDEHNEDIEKDELYKLGLAAIAKAELRQ